MEAAQRIHILLKPKVDEKDLEAALLRLDSIANDIRNEKFTFDDEMCIRDRL